jgi:hypothetical protein
MLVIGKTSSMVLPGDDPAIRTYSLARDEQQPTRGAPPEGPGIGFEHNADLRELFETLPHD